MGRRLAAPDIDIHFFKDPLAPAHGFLTNLGKRTWRVLVWIGLSFVVGSGVGHWMSVGRFPLLLGRRAVLRVLLATWVAGRAVRRLVVVGKNSRKSSKLRAVD